MRYDDGMLGPVESKEHIQFICRPSQDTGGVISGVVDDVKINTGDEHVGILDILQDGMLVVDVEADALWEKGC